MPLTSGTHLGAIFAWGERLGTLAGGWLAAECGCGRGGNCRDSTIHRDQLTPLRRHFGPVTGQPTAIIRPANPNSLSREAPLPGSRTPDRPARTAI